MFLHCATPVLNANVRAFNLFAQSPKPHKYILSLGGALSWPEKVNTDRFMKTGFPGHRVGSREWLGWASGLGTLQSLTGTGEPCPVCFPCLTAAAAPLLAGWWTHCSLLGEALGVLPFPSWDTQVGISSPQQMGGPLPPPRVLQPLH